MTETPQAHAPCPVCGSPDDFMSTFRGLDQCRTCSFVMFSDVRQVDFEALYGESYFRGFEYADYLGEQDALRRSMRRHLRQMEHYQELGGDLFEIGCAYGLFLDEARASFRRVSGVDISHEATAYARDTLGIDARDTDFLAMDLSDRRFEAICMWDTIEHVPAPDRFVRKAAELLSETGVFYLTTGDIGSLVARVQGASWRQIHPPSHVGYFSRLTIRTMLARCGLQVVGIETAPYYHTLYNVLKTLDLRGGAVGRIARAALRMVREGTARRIGGWIDLGDIMFVAARRPGSSGGASEASAH